MSPATRLGLVVAAATLIADQVSKLWILFVYDLPETGRVAVLPFLDLAMVWNRGISYGLFQQDGLYGRLGLLAITLVAVVILTIWLRREESRLAGFGIGLILGGAIGNAVDRLTYGAVADFVLLHAAGFEWYVFNAADAAIVVGVAVLLYGTLRRGDRSAEATAQDR
jgi:signal peptidase II